MGDPALSKTQQQFKRSRPVSLLASRSYRFAAVVAVAAIVIATAVPPAFAGKCDQVPYGVEHSYDTLPALSAKLFGDPTSIDDLLSKICRAKYMHDAEALKALHQIGFSDEFIHGNDVGFIAVKVLKAAADCILAHPNDASRC